MSRQYKEKMDLVTSDHEALIQLTLCLGRAKSLVPNDENNLLFGSLVKNVCDLNDDFKSGDLDIEKIRPKMNLICAKGEELLEKYWAEKFLGMKDLNFERLKEFVYFRNYQLLADWEYELICDYMALKPAKIMFVGSGSLPLSALLMTVRYGVTIDCFDCDFEAVKSSRELVARMGLSDCVKIVHGDFFEQKNFEQYDLVMIAALVGFTEVEKKNVLAHLNVFLPKGKAFLMRSADKLKTLLYQEVKQEWLGDFQSVKVFHPEGEVINSVILAKK